MEAKIAIFNTHRGWLQLEGYERMHLFPSCSDQPIKQPKNRYMTQRHIQMNAQHTCLRGMQCTHTHMCMIWSRSSHAERTERDAFSLQPATTRLCCSGVHRCGQTQWMHRKQGFFLWALGREVGIHPPSETYSWGVAKKAD